MSRAPEQRLDLDLHGLLGLRLVDPGPSDVAAFRRTFGGLEAPLAGAPDVVVRYVDRLPLRDLRFVEIGRSGFTDEGFVLLAHGRHPVGVRLDLDRLGAGCEIVCERGRRSLPVLLPILSLVLLAKGVAPLHASAFELRGTGVIAAGWAHGGKTSALLAFAERGAAYVGDDLVLLADGGERMYGFPAPLELWDWQAEGLSAVRGRVGQGRRALSQAARRLGALEARIPDTLPHDGLARRLLRRVAPAAQRRLKLEVPLDLVFGTRVPLAAEPRKVFLMMSHASPDVRVEPADPLEVAERLALSIQQEMLGLAEQYLAYRYAFPDRRSDLVEGAHALASELLRRALADKDVALVRHPYPVPLADLYAAMRPHCEARCTATV